MNESIPAYFTMDAGPNVKVICKASDIPAILEELCKVFSENSFLRFQEGIRVDRTNGTLLVQFREEVST